MFPLSVELVRQIRRVRHLREALTMFGSHGALIAGVGAGVIAVGGTGVVVVSDADSEVTRVAITVGGAIIVALITWYATDRRQTKAISSEETRHAESLGGERERHAESLKGESDRLELRLRHERDLNDRQALRAFLDVVAEDMEELLDKLGDLYVTVKHRPDEDTIAMETKAVLLVALAMRVTQRRVWMRVPVTDGIATAVDSFVTAGMAAQEKLTGSKEWEGKARGERVTAADEDIAQMFRQLFEFATAVRTKFE